MPVPPLPVADVGDITDLDALMHVEAVSLFTNGRWPSGPISRSPPRTRRRLSRSGEPTRRSAAGHRAGGLPAPPSSGVVDPGAPRCPDAQLRARSTFRSGSARSRGRSNGAMTSSIRRPRSSSPGCRCSPVVVASRRSRRSAGRPTTSGLDVFEGLGSLLDQALVRRTDSDGCSSLPDAPRDPGVLHGAAAGLRGRRRPAPPPSRDLHRDDRGDRSSIARQSSASNGWTSPRRSTTTCEPPWSGRNLLARSTSPFAWSQHRGASGRPEDIFTRRGDGSR